MKSDKQKLSKAQELLQISFCETIAVRVTSLFDSLARSGTVISKWDICNFLKLTRMYLW